MVAFFIRKESVTVLQKSRYNLWPTKQNFSLKQNVMSQTIQSFLLFPIHCYLHYSVSSTILGVHNDSYIGLNCMQPVT